MSSQKGNAKRTRPQKYQNSTAFKNDLHDTSRRTKQIKNMEIKEVCERCKNILAWKIKYKKYKVLKDAAKCNKCLEKRVVHSYHRICLPCAKQSKSCPKCCQQFDQGVSESVSKEPTENAASKNEATEKSANIMSPGSEIDSEDESDDYSS